MEQKTYHFDEVRGSLIFSVSKVEIEIAGDDILTGSFEVEEQNGFDMEGYVYSSNIRMRVDTPQIAGSHQVVEFTFEPEGMKAGEVLKGNFFIVTNRGEYVIPFLVMRQRSVLESSLGNIKNLFHFTNLAKSEWREATEVFCNPEFVHIMTGNDARFINLYRGLSGQGNKNYNLEEFLIGINKKQKIEYSIDNDSVRIDNPVADVTNTIRIEKNGWGYVNMEVRVKGDFISLSKTRLSDKDFDNDVCLFEYTVNSNMLKTGSNEGQIKLITRYDEITIDIIANKSGFGKRSINGHKQKSMTFALMRHYMDYTVKRITMSKWIMLTEELFNHRGTIGVDDLETSLMRIHLLLIQEKYAEAKWVLDKRVNNQNLDEVSNELYCYSMYLDSLYCADDFYTRQVTDRIRSIYEKDRLNWRVAWILMKIDEEISSSASRRFAWAVEQIRMGSTSPVMYLEAIKALCESPSLLLRLDHEEKQIILFGAREGILTPDLMAQVSYLVLKAKNYDKTLLRIMKLIYEKTDSDESLQSVCVQLMKGGKTGEEYYPYYEKAVERNFPLTRLYESYMMSMDLRQNEHIPKRVLMYFSYESTLPPAQNAYLYSYVVKHKQELQEIYLSYRDNIERFVVRELYAGRIDRNMAYLYSNVLMENLMTPDNMKQFAKLMFVHCITVEDKNIARVVVIDDRLKAEMVYPITGGCAYVQLIGNEYTILLEDREGNRFYQTREYNTERFFMPGKLMLKLEDAAKDSLPLNLYACEDTIDFLIVTDRYVERYEFLEKCDQITEEYKGKIRLPLIRYYLDKDEGAKIDEIISHIRYDDISFKDYNELIRLMIIRGNYDTALDFVLHYGVDNIEPKNLVRLASGIIERNGMYEQEKLTYILINAFERGKYDITGISYLAAYIKGPTKKLRNVWKAASNFDIDTYDICERMILQTLQTGAYIGEEAQVLKQYVDGGAKSEVEMHYLSYFAHESFVHGRLVDDYIFSEMERLYRVEGKLTDICMIAWLKFLSEKIKTEQVDEKTKEVIRELIRILVVNKEIVFPFFGEFRDISPNATQISNQTLVEYRGTPGVKTVINYVISKEQSEGGGFCREDMTDMYGGVFVKQFLLFFGETLQYYITEENGINSQLTVSETYRKSEANSDSNGDRYSMVDDIAIATTLQDYDTAAKLLEEYKYKEYLVNSIFTPQ